MRLIWLILAFSFGEVFAQTENQIIIKQLNTCGPFFVFGVPNKMEIIVEGALCKDYTIECKKCIAQKEDKCIVNITPTDTIGDIIFTVKYKNNVYTYTNFSRLAESPTFTIHSWTREPPGYQLDSLVCYNGERCLPFNYVILDYEFEFIKNNQKIYKSKNIGPAFKKEDQIASLPLMPGDTIHLYNINIVGMDNIYRTIKECYLIVR